MSRFVNIVAWLNVPAFFVLENNYFGWNMTPQSAEEVLADGMVLILLALAAIANRRECDLC